MELDVADIIGRVEFFPPFEAPRQLPQPPVPEWIRPPATQLPAIVPLRLLVYRSESIVVALEAARVYTSGVTLEVRWARRRTSETQSEWINATRGPWGHPRPGWPGSIRFGIQYPDGSKAFTDPRPGMPPAVDFRATPKGPVLHQAGGSSDGGDHDMQTGDFRLWAWLLPGPGAHRLYVEWLDAALPESFVEFDGGALHEAAAEARPFWPDSV